MLPRAGSVPRGPRIVAGAGLLFSSSERPPWCSLRSKKHSRTIEHCGRRGWRWALDVSWTHISLERHVIFLDREEAKWGLAASYFGVNLTKHFALGSQHVYYDGPHCSFSLGFLHLSWSYWWCKKCCAEIVRSTSVEASRKNFENYTLPYVGCPACEERVASGAYGTLGVQGSRLGQASGRRTRRMRR